MKKLYGYFGGSDMYGLPAIGSSDTDYYAVGTSTRIKEPKIYPQERVHIKKRTAKLDVEHLELCAYFTFLMNGFLFQVESLFVPDDRTHAVDPDFRRLVLDKKNLLIDRSRLLENVEGNIKFVRSRTTKDIEGVKDRALKATTSEKVRQGVLRMHAEYVAKGYYHRDYLHHIRIAASVANFLRTDNYVLNLANCDPEAHKMCCDIKENPNKFTRKELDEFLDPYLDFLNMTNLDGDEDKFRFDASYAQKTLAEFYA